MPYILTEDASHGRVLEEVEFLNPCAPEFDGATIGLDLPAP